MGAFEKLRSGLDMSCGNFAKRYAQQIVLVNRIDIELKAILTSVTGIDDSYECRHRVYFKLFDGKTGYRFTMNQNAAVIFGSAEKTTEQGIPQYLHIVNLAVLGVSEESRCVLSQMDYGDYFAALQYGDGTIEIYGFEYGLSSTDYTYDPANTGGGALIKLSNLEDSLEDALPFFYRSSTPGGEVTDFDNAFAENEFNVLGDFNDDFNDDFNNQGS